MSELGSLLELLGPDATLKIVEEFGGTRLGVPKEMPAAHRLRELLGDAGFTLLFQYFGGSEIAVPMARKWRFEVYERRGLKPREIARLAGCTEAAYYAYRSKRGQAEQRAFDFEDSGVPHGGRR